MDHIQRVDDVSEGLAHLSAVLVSDQRVEQHLRGTGVAEGTVDEAGPLHGGALTCWKGSCPVSWVPSITILATQKKIRSLPVSRMELG